eukprot:COSAG02_NODE_6180_length_3748_cov_6.877501_4_plen_50_part_00
METLVHVPHPSVAVVAHVAPVVCTNQKHFGFHYGLTLKPDIRGPEVEVA